MLLVYFGVFQCPTLKLAIVCDVKFENFGAPVTDGGCNMPCQGNSSELCGGPNRLNVYNYTGVITTVPTPPGNGGGGGPPANGPPPPPVTSGLPTTWNYSGCYVWVLQ